MKGRLKGIIEKARTADKVIIVGAGKRGKELFWHLRQNEISVSYFFDNSKLSIGKEIEGVKILVPQNMGNMRGLYIIAIDGLAGQESLHKQLQSLGIKENDIMIFDCFWNYDYMSNLDESYYVEEVQRMYEERFGRRIDWQNPVTYNEKINCEKLLCRDKIRTILADKLLVREWIAEKIGVRYLNKIYKVWDNPEEIDFEELPEKFVLKMNNASGRNIIVKDKGGMDWNLVRRQLGEWKKRNFAYDCFELHYKDIVPKIFCEAYLEGVADKVYEYDIYCFHGEPAYIWCINGSHKTNCKASFYNKNWEMQSFSYGYPKDEQIAPKPEKLEEMLELSKVLSSDFQHVRVDWYNLPDGRVLFGEMTFTTWGGLSKFDPDEWDTVFGKMI